MILEDKSMKLIKKFIQRAFWSYRHGYTSDDTHTFDLRFEVWRNNLREDCVLVDHRVSLGVAHTEVEHGHTI